METTNLIPIKLVCKHYNIPVGFINTLSEYNFIELIVEDSNLFIHKKQLKEVEKIVRLHYDLNINMEGIDAIHNLLEKVNELKVEIKKLNNRLRLYEDL